MNGLIPARGACYVDLLIRMAQDARLIDELAGVQNFLRDMLSGNMNQVVGRYLVIRVRKTRTTVGTPLTMGSRRHELPNAQIAQGFGTA